MTSSGLAVMRKANQMADSLAKLGLTAPPANQIIDVMSKYLHGVPHHRAGERERDGVIDTRCFSNNSSEIMKYHIFQTGFLSFSFGKQTNKTTRK